MASKRVDRGAMLLDPGFDRVLEECDFDELIDIARQTGNVYFFDRNTGVEISFYDVNHGKFSVKSSAHKTMKENIRACIHKMAEIRELVGGWDE